MTKRKKSILTLKDILSHLSYNDACKLLGPQAKRLLGSLSSFDLDIQHNVRLTMRRMTMSFQPISKAVVTMQYSERSKSRLLFRCSQCDNNCEHIGAAFSLILEEKLALGLSEAPEPFEKTSELSNTELIELELAARLKRANEEKMAVRSTDPDSPWADYRVRSKQSGKTYRVSVSASIYTRCKVGCRASFPRANWQRNRLSAKPLYICITVMTFHCACRYHQVAVRNSALWCNRLSINQSSLLKNC